MTTRSGGLDSSSSVSETFFSFLDGFGDIGGDESAVNVAVITSFTGFTVAGTSFALPTELFFKLSLAFVSFGNITPTMIKAMPTSRMMNLTSIIFGSNTITPLILK